MLIVYYLVDNSIQCEPKNQYYVRMLYKDYNLFSKR